MTRRKESWGFVFDFWDNDYYTTMLNSVEKYSEILKDNFDNEIYKLMKEEEVRNSLRTIFLGEYITLCYDQTNLNDLIEDAKRITSIFDWENKENSWFFGTIGEIDNYVEKYRDSNNKLWNNCGTIMFKVKDKQINYEVI